jgi:hypothetical protein
MQNRFINLILILASIFTGSTWAKGPVYFLPEKNNLQILPQKFEYNLLNNTTIKIGDIVIDSNNLSLELTNERSQYGFTFNWPAGLFQHAELVLFNNYGKAIKNYTINKGDVELIKDQKDGDKSNSDSLVRKDKAIFKTGIEQELIDEIKYLPFFKFCLQRKEENTRIDLCSVELYFSSKDGKPAIKMRSENKKKAQILVNNAEVGEQGIIFLNDLSESINFKAQSESGAKLEIETRLKPVDFQDVVVSEDGTSLLLTGMGSLPVSDKNVKIINESSWQIRLPIEFPVFYIQGEGGIPFRQEFFVRGGLPTENIRAQSPDLISDTYFSSEKMTLELAKGTTVASKETNSKVSQNKSQKIDWTVSGLEKGKDNKRILYIKKDKNEYAIYQSIYRAPPFEAQLGISHYSAQKMSFANLGLNYWITKRSGLALKMDQAVTKTDTVDKWSIMEISYLHRFKSGLNFRDPYFYGSAHMRNSTISTLSFSQMGLGVGQNARFQSAYFTPIADWYNWNFKYFMGAKSNEIEIKSLMVVDYKFLLELSRSYYFNYGLEVQSISVSGMEEIKSSQVNANFGITYLF